ncbi:type II toxin-antitoxin system RelE/ParE family toxin [Candidatus Sumerlaeota bacterium]|nr:type II toxin-antitoxin system RelE/ParE family toxin [Candidatus Sumerlaeota bacterium]
MAFQVKYTPSAKADLRKAYQWLLEESRSPEIAYTWFNEITQAVESLTDNPKRCKLAPENNYFSQEIRQLLYGKRHGQYRVLFTIEESTVWILHLRHCAQEHLR